MRKKLIKELFQDIHGPREGSYEQLEGYPFNEYITGIIISNNAKNDEKRDPDSESINLDENPFNEDDFSEGEIAPTIPSELNPQIKPKSFGISFTTNKKHPALKICVTWGKYSKDKDTNNWKRKPFCKIIENLNSNEETIYEKKGRIYLSLRRVESGKNYHFTLSLVNDLEYNKDNIIDSTIFQPAIKIILKDNTELIDPEFIEDDTISYLYRDQPAKARGHMCSAVWKDVDYLNDLFSDKSTLWADGTSFEGCDEFFESDIRTEFVPLYPMPSPVYDLPVFSNQESLFTAVILSELWNSTQIEKSLNPIIYKYNDWINSQKENDNKKIVNKLISTQLKASNRIKKGIELIKNDENVRLAFCFANNVIEVQSKWKDDQNDKEHEFFKWRPFQLAFFLMCIESIANENSEFKDTLDLLWIPTGGGKTEAYLGIMAFTMALRRIKSSKGLSSNKTGAGTTIISRYTLRLLTVQQFRRTLQMVTAAEFLRVYKNLDGTIGWKPKSCTVKNDWIYGSTRFSVGMWVGSSVSPNNIKTTSQYSIGALDSLSGEKSAGEPAQIISCPVCGNFLTIPKRGLPKGKNKIYIVSKILNNKINLNEKIEELVSNSENIDNIEIINKNHKETFITISLNLSSGKPLKKHDLKKIWKEIRKNLNVKAVSLSFDKMGYFGSVRELGRKNFTYSDFEIWCTNPECSLNNNVHWKEGIPSNSKNFDFPDELIENNDLLSYFSDNSRIPIPALTVDEQIYSHCPTVIISTVDKIARLAFEPKAGTIFGDVNEYNSCYGYNRGILPKNYTAGCVNSSFNIKKFEPPELIVQDELHLIDGPLGSMFGLYESIIEGIIKDMGGHPKYVASTATIKNAANQVSLLYDRDTFQFPPYGLTISDSFFVKNTNFKDAWDKKRTGKIYMGVYSPGLGPLYPLVKIWAILLKTPFEYKKQYENELKYFWTVVGYYNAIRELGGGTALYRDDIMNQLNKISKMANSQRYLDQDNFIELSSRKDSTSIPLILNELEKDGKKEQPSYDALFTTSMFGTGIDVSHLSLMVVNGQPKTTGSYIQATGRIGRSFGGLVVSFLRNGRPRDLSHYEMFMGYHHKIHQEVEPVSVSPFSVGALRRGTGPSIVSYLRNIPDSNVGWKKDDGSVINGNRDERDIQNLIKHLEGRILSINSREDSKQNKLDLQGIIDFFNSELDRWDNLTSQKDFVFNEYGNNPSNNVVLGDSNHEKNNKEIVYHNALQSLRDVEQTLGFWVK